jgi:hypothetical protein
MFQLLLELSHKGIVSLIVMLSAILKPKKISESIYKTIVAFIAVAVFTTLLVNTLFLGTASAVEPDTDKNVVNCSPQTIDKGESGTGEYENCEVVASCNKKDALPDSENCIIIKYVQIFINILSGLVGVAVIGSLIVGGIQYSASAGDPQAVAAARKRISNALFALLAFALMYGFLQWIVPGGVL